MQKIINQWYNISVYLAGAATLVAILVPMDITARLLWASISILSSTSSRSSVLPAVSPIWA